MKQKARYLGRNDEWSETMRARLMNVHDLPEATRCLSPKMQCEFCTNRQLPEVYEGDDLRSAEKKKRKVRCPKSTEKKTGFCKSYLVS